MIDTDLIARELVTPGSAALAAIQAEFGAAVLSGGELDRPALRRIVFAAPERRRALEAILHPLILAEAARRLDGLAAPCAVLVVPLLVEHLADWRPLIDRLLVIDCTESLQLRRLTARDGVPAELAQAMLAAQTSRESRRAVADTTLVNEGEPDELCHAVERLLSAWLPAGTAA